MTKFIKVNFPYKGILVTVSTLIVGIFFLFPEVFIKGYVISAGDIILTNPAIRENVPENFAGINNPLQSDQVFQFYVWHTLVRQNIKSYGKIPLWNPYILGGQPLLANAQPGLFYPPHLLLFWLDVGTVTTISSLLNILLSGIFTYLYARILNIGRWGATLSAISFAFSGTILVGPWHAYVNALVWLPLMLLACEKLVTSNSKKDIWSGILAFAVGISILGGHPETSFHCIIVTLIYLLIRTIQLKSIGKTFWVILGYGTFGVLLGCFLGSVQLLPFVTFLSESGIQTRSRAWNSESFYYSKEWLNNTATLITLIFPNFFGNPVDKNYLWPFPNYQNFLEQTFFFGLYPFILTLSSMSLPPKNKKIIWLLIVLGLILLLISFRWPGVEIINHLPVFNKVNNTRFKWIFSLLGAVLSGFSLDWLSQNTLEKKSQKTTQSFLLIMSVAVTLFLLLPVIKFLLLTTNKLDSSFISHFFNNIASFNNFRFSFYYLLAIISSITILSYHFYQRLFFLKYTIIFLTFVELIIASKNYNTTLPPKYIFPETSFTRFFKQDTSIYRIQTDSSIFWPNYHAVYGIMGIGGYDLPVYQSVFDINRIQGGKNYRQIWEPTWPLVDWVNIKYIISPRILSDEKYKLIFEQPGIYIYRNENVFDRVTIVQNAIIQPNREAILQELVSRKFKFSESVMLEVPPSDFPLHNKFDTHKKAQIVRYEMDEVEIRTSTNTTQYLVMSDVYTKGWKAYINGHSTQLYRANYAYRAIELPAGENTVVFRYEPIDFMVGAWLSGVSALVIVALLILQFRKLGSSAN